MNPPRSGSVCVSYKYHQYLSVYLICPSISHTILCLAMLFCHLYQCFHRKQLLQIFTGLGVLSCLGIIIADATILYTVFYIRNPTGLHDWHF